MGVLTMNQVPQDAQFERRLSDRSTRGAAAVLLVCCATISGGCETPSAHTFSRDYSLRPDLNVDPPSGHENSEEQDCIEGGRLYKYYCGSCHNARPLSERPFSNYQVAITHMRGQAYLTGEEYRQIIMFVRRWHELGPPTPDVKPSPKRMIFSQPISELRKDSSEGPAAPPPDGAGPFNEPAGAAPPAAEAPGAAAPGARGPDANLPAPIN
jgi:hypothetical protein